MKPRSHYLVLLFVAATFAVCCASGTAGAASGGSIKVSPSTINFGNQAIGTQSASQTVTITNSGSSSITVKGLTVGKGFTLVSPPALPFTLGAGKNTKVSLAFAPSLIGATSQSFHVTSTATSGTGVSTLSGTGTGASGVTMSPSSLTFGSQTVNVTSTPQTITFTNITTSKMTISQIAAAGNFAQTNTCGTSLDSGVSCSVNVTFTPTTTGNLTGSVTITDSGVGSPESAGLSGTGVAASGGPITLSPVSLSFGNVPVGTTSASQTIAVTNTSGSNLTLNGISVTSPFPITSQPPLPLGLNPGETTHINVAFAPTAAGTDTGTLTVTSTAGNASASLSGTGTGSGSSLSITTTSLPAATVSQAYSTTVTATGGMTPYSWSISSGSLPSGITLSGSSGTVSGTPTQAGTSSFTVKVTDSSSPAQTATQALTLTVNASSSGLSITTTSLPVAIVSQAYSTTVSATGGKTPYSWSISSGSLPAGISLASSGAISGTPTQAGLSSFTIKVTDSSSPTQTATQALTITVNASSGGGLDVYGGTTALACPKGPSAHFYTQKIGTRWWLCTPAGNAFWLRGVYHADDADSTPDYQGVVQSGTTCASMTSASPSNPCSVIQYKYGDGSTTWGPQTVVRLLSRGFNGIAEFASDYVLPTTTNSAWKTSDQSNPQKVPFTPLLWPSHYSRNANSYAQPVKDLIGPISTSVYTDYRHASPDVWDPNFATWLQKDLADPANAEYGWIHSPHSDYLIGFNVDDTDELFGFGAGPDFPTLTNGNLDTGNGRWQLHLGWAILITPPTQSSGVDGNGNNITYSDTTVYSKQQLSSWLATRYSNNIAALNSAWGSTYTTFGSAGGWGHGTGLLDEDGTHSWVSKDPYKLSGSTAAMQADLNAFLVVHAQQYFTVIKNALQAAAPGVLYLGPTNLGAWGAPARSQILQAASTILDGLTISSIPTGCLSCSDDQARIDFVTTNGGDKPWLVWEGFFAQPDSYMSIYPAPDTSFPHTSTQTARGTQFQSMVTGLVTAKDSSTSTYHIVGYKWWELYDNRGETANWGLLTRRDNAYDGKQAIIATGKDSYGYSTGGEQANYSDFLDTVNVANSGIYSTAISLP